MVHCEMTGKSAGKPFSLDMSGWEADDWEVNLSTLFGVVAF